MSHLKTTRTTAKRAVTRDINLIRQAVAEGDTVSLSERVAKLKDVFKAFNVCHEEYHNTLTDDSDIEESDMYF